LGSGKTEFSSEYLGDGIVPLSSQQIDQISGFPASGNYRFTSYNNGRDDLHVEETKRTTYIINGLNLVSTWWL